MSCITGSIFTTSTAWPLRTIVIQGPNMQSRASIRGTERSNGFPDSDPFEQHYGIFKPLSAFTMKSCRRRHPFPFEIRPQ